MQTRLGITVGAHEPIFHRQRTGNSTAEEWKRWEQETSRENLDLLCELGVTHVHIACTKGFGLEYEKPLIERAADFAHRAAERGIATSAYIQGFPVYYETFLIETPEAIDWLARRQNGDFIPWGGQTFRRWMDPTRREFHEYQFRLVDYILQQFHPVRFGLDNTIVPTFYSDSARKSFRAYLQERYDESAALREFGLRSLEQVDLPRFDPIYFPADAMRIVKDPILQEWARWQSWVTAGFCRELRERIHAIAPEVQLSSASGCDGLRYNQLFARGVDFEDRIDALDVTHMEEAGWRPGVIEPTAENRRTIVMDERQPDAQDPEAAGALRVSTDSRFMKILGEYGMQSHRGFWGEFDRASKLVAVAHNFTFAHNAANLGTVGPLAADARMLDDLRDVIDWSNHHLPLLAGRENRHAPVAVWRSTSTCGFIRHQPVWEACAVEQMLYEQHIPFTILLDGGLERFLENRSVLILPGTSCVSDAQIARLMEFVRAGGSLLLLGQAGTRDERTRVRQTYAFEKCFGGALPTLERIGPPHWVPTLDFDRMPETLTASFGKGTVALVKHITPATELDLTRDPYMPERQVMAKDVRPPANEAQVMDVLNELYGRTSLRLEAPRWVLCEYWQRGNDLLVAMANLRKGRWARGIRLRTGQLPVRTARFTAMLEDEPIELTCLDGVMDVPMFEHFGIIECPGALG